MQPVLKLLLGPEGEELRSLVIKESIRVSEAVTLGGIVDLYKSIPESMRAMLPINNGNQPLALSDTELESMLELRDQVLRIWALLRSSKSFDPSILQPILQVNMRHISLCKSCASELNCY